jgi:site-specific recombinase XerD
MTPLAPLLQGFFAERLSENRASPHTVSSYRDTFCLLLRFAAAATGKAPSELGLADLDHVMVGAFLDDVESGRGCSISTRNLRRTAIRSFFGYAALYCPEQSLVIQRVLAIPQKRGDKRIVSFLTKDEAEALLKSPDRTSFIGRRDHALMTVAVQAGLRVSELTGLTCADLELGTGANVHCKGKGRKERRTPLTPTTARLMRTWSAERAGAPGDPLFPAREGGRMSTDAVAKLVAKHAATATAACPSMANKRVTPHVLRHTCAMSLLQAGIETSVIALWLGHASTQATQIYLHADLKLKERALALTDPPEAASRGRYRPTDSLLAFLEGL